MIQLTSCFVSWLYSVGCAIFASAAIGIALGFIVTLFRHPLTAFALFMHAFLVLVFGGMAWTAYVGNIDGAEGWASIVGLTMGGIAGVWVIKIILHTIWDAPIAPFTGSSRGTPPGRE